MAEATNIEFNKNEDEFKQAISKLNGRLEDIKLGGGLKKLEKLKAKGKLTARERIEYLIDENSFFEIGAFAGFDMYKDHGGAPAAGVIVGLAKIEGRSCVVVANDPSVKAGAWFPMTGKKNLRAQEIAMENKLPIVYLVDSAGVYLPMQNEIFPDKEHFGRIFRNNAKMSAAGIPQIAAIMGSCVAGGAYLPIMSDESIIVEGTGSIFLAGPYLVKAAIGETVDKETLGGATTQTEISGVCDYKAKDDKEALDIIKDLMSKMGPSGPSMIDRDEAVNPKYDTAEILGITPTDPTKPYDTVEVLKRIVDNSELTFYKEDYGKTIITAYARIDGWAVGIVANSRLVTKNAKGEMQFGGVIYSDSADKATRFILNCNQKKIPLVFIHDVTGFMVGKRSEHGGIIKDGAKMVNAVSNSTVPKISIVIGNSYGAGNYAMCGKAYDPRFIVGWPTARVAVMGGTQAAKVMTQIEVSRLQKSGEEPDEDRKKEIFEKIKAKYDAETSAYYAAARLWLDAIIDPRDTRSFISQALESVSKAPISDFNVGVIQT